MGYFEFILAFIETFQFAGVSAFIGGRGADHSNMKPGFDCFPPGNAAFFRAIETIQFFNNCTV
jgi:hypothetical protein